MEINDQREQKEEEEKERDEDDNCKWFGLYRWR